MAEKENLPDNPVPDQPGWQRQVAALVDQAGRDLAELKRSGGYTAEPGLYVQRLDEVISSLDSGIAQCRSIEMEEEERKVEELLNDARDDLVEMREKFAPPAAEPPDEPKNLESKYDSAGKTIEKALAALMETGNWDPRRDGMTTRDGPTTGTTPAKSDTN